MMRVGCFSNKPSGELQAFFRRHFSNVTFIQGTVLDIPTLKLAKVCTCTIALIIFIRRSENRQSQRQTTKVMKYKSRTKPKITKCQVAGAIQFMPLRNEKIQNHVMTTKLLQVLQESNISAYKLSKWPCFSHFTVHQWYTLPSAFQSDCHNENLKNNLLQYCSHSTV